MKELYGYRKLNNLTAISEETTEYRGYLWFSDESKPRLVDGTVDFSGYIKNPFIIEGHLFAKDESRSISIKEVGGELVIGEVKWNEIPSVVHLESKIYLRRLSAGFVEFVEAWVPEQDPWCENFEVLTPAWIAFKGFKKQRGGQL